MGVQSSFGFTLGRMEKGRLTPSVFCFAKSTSLKEGG